DRSYRERASPTGITTSTKRTMREEATSKHRDAERCVIASSTHPTSYRGYRLSLRVFLGALADLRGSTPGTFSPCPRLSAASEKVPNLVNLKSQGGWRLMMIGARPSTGLGSGPEGRVAEWRGRA